MFIREIDIENFLERNNIDQIKSNEVKSVDMDMCDISSEDKPVLFTYGLATCIGLVATSKEFAFLSHIDMGYGQNDFETEWIQLPDGKWDFNVKRCNITWELYNRIYQKRDEITKPIEVTVVLGSMPVDKNNTKRIFLERGIDNTINMCAKNLGITVNRLPNVNSTSVLVDSRNSKIILDKDLRIDEQEINIEENKAIKLQNTVKTSKQMSTQIKNMKIQLQEVEIFLNGKNINGDDR